MGQQDLSSKVLESHNDIFANIFNTFVFGGKPMLQPEYLQDEPTENVFLDNDGNYRNNLRDVFKTYKYNGTGEPVRLAYFGIENQTIIDPTMVVRTLSYTANNYKKQCDDIAIARRALNKELKKATVDSQKILIEQELEDYSYTNLCPTITLVLNFSKQKWENNINLCELIKDSNPFKPYVQNFKLNVVNIMYLSVEEIRQLSKDFRALVYFLVKRETTLDELQYPLEVLMALYAYTNDARFLTRKSDILQKLSQGGKITMPEILDEYIEKRTAAIVDELTAEITDKVTAEVTDKVTAEVTDKVTAEVTDKVTAEVTDKVTAEVTDKVTAENTIQFAKKLIALGHNSLDEIAEVTSLPLEKIQELAKEQVA